MRSGDEIDLFERNMDGKVIGRNILITVYVDGKIRVKGPSDVKLTTHFLKKAIEAVQGERADTSYPGVEIIRAM